MSATPLLSTEIKERAVCVAIKNAWKECVAPSVLPNSCVLAAKVVSEVLGRLNMPAFVMPTRVLAMNEIMFRHQMDNVHYSQWTEEAWSVGAGYDRTDATLVDNRLDHGFNGHLIVATSTCFVDLTAGQFSRPEKNIETGGPIVDSLDNLDFSFTLPVDPGSPFAHYRLAYGGHVLYETSEDYSYEKSRDWTLNYVYFIDEVHSRVRFLCGDVL